MMNQLTLSLNVFIFGLIILGSIFIGFILGRRKIVDRENRIIELEREMLRSHEEILNLTHENTQLIENKDAVKVKTGTEVNDPKLRKIS